MITKIIICIIIVTYCHYIVTVYITFNITTTKSITMSLYCYYRFVMVLIIAVVVIAYYCNNCNTLDSVQFSVQFWFEALCVQIARRPPHSNAFIVLISDVLQNLQIVTHQNPQNPHRIHTVQRLNSVVQSQKVSWCEWLENLMVSSGDQSTEVAPAVAVNIWSVLQNSWHTMDFHHISETSNCW